MASPGNQHCADCIGTLSFLYSLSDSCPPSYVASGVLSNAAVRLSVSVCLSHALSSKPVHVIAVYGYCKAPIGNHILEVESTCQRSPTAIDRESGFYDFNFFNS